MGPSPQPADSQTPRSIWRARVRVAAISIVLTAIIFSAAVLGWSARRWVWDVTDPIRFLPDAQRQCYWAVVSSGPEGYLNQYEKMSIQTRQWGVWLDYVPLRLLVMRQWGVYLHKYYPEVSSGDALQVYQRSYAFSAPLLRFNAAMDALAAICGLLLTRLWVRRSSEAPTAIFTGMGQGVVAALLIWLNPATLLSAYAWPTWDSWIAPMYLAAVLLASIDWWFSAGVVIAIGAMLKGQQLAVAPIFVVWPLLQRRFGAATRWCIGITFGMAIIASPWLLTSIPPAQLQAARHLQDSLRIEQYPPQLFAFARSFNVAALCWIIGAVLAVIGLPLIPLDRLRSRTAMAVRIAALTVAIAWPWVLAPNRADGLLGIAAVVATGWALLKIPALKRGYIVAAVAGGTLLLSMRLFDTSHAWWDCGFGFGASRWHWTASSITDNLPGLLFERFGWSKNPDQVAVTFSAIGQHWPAFLERWGWWPACTIGVSAKQLFNPLFVITLLICAIGLSRMAARKDRRTLIAMTTPWLIFFLLPVEIHGRYALYPATISAICIGESIGMALLGAFITLAATTMILDALLQGGHPFGLQLLLSARYPNWIASDSVQSLYRVLERTHPDMAWGLFVVAAVFIYQTFVPGKHRQSRGVDRITIDAVADPPSNDVVSSG